MEQEVTAKRVIECIFGKRINDSFYHLNTFYINRVEIGMSNEDIFAFMTSQIDKILTEQVIDDEAKILLSKANNLLKTTKDIVEINKLFGLISYLGYEIWFIIRKDLSEAFEVRDSNRAYLMNKSILNEVLPNINVVQVGISNLFENQSELNLSSMVMSFVEQKKVSLGDEADTNLINLPNLIDQYRELAKSNETYIFNSAKILKLLEGMNYKFFMSINVLPDRD